jgi:hypothetical protein
LKNGFFATANGFELPWLYAVSALAVTLTGAGRVSLDAWFGLAFLNGPCLVAGVLALAVIGAAVTLASRRQVRREAAAA